MMSYSDGHRQVAPTEDMADAPETALDLSVKLKEDIKAYYAPIHGRCLIVGDTKLLAR